jgi:hypothetical protein
MGFNLDNYEQVKDRIARFYGDHADGRIITDLVTDPKDLKDCAGFKAYVYIGETVKATGYAYEDKGQGVNKDAWVENAETSAIGRALANMDYCGTMRPSREEMSKVSQKPTESHSVKPIDSQPTKEQLEGKALADDLELTQADKNALWIGCGKDQAKYLIALKAQKTDLKNSLRAILTDPKLKTNDEAKQTLGIIDMMSCCDIRTKIVEWEGLLKSLVDLF